MVYAKTKADGLTVFYHPKEQYLVGFTIAAFAIVFGFVAYGILQAQLDGLIVFAASAIGLIACAMGIFAMYSLRNGWRRSRHPIWLLRFTPDDVHVNLVHPGYLNASGRGAPQSLSIPTTSIHWIRQTTKPGIWDEDRDEIYIEMRVSDSTFRSVSARRDAVRKSMDKVGTSDLETILRLFEGNVIRVLLEGDRWPSEIADYWAAHSYSTTASFTIEEPRDISAAKTQPRELF